MVSFLYPRKNHSRLPHSQAFESMTKHTRRHSHPATEQTSPQIEEPHAHPGAADLDTYTASMRRWTLRQFRTSFPTVSHRLSRHQYSYTSSSHTPTTVSPLYPTDSSLYNCSIKTPRPDSAEAEEEEELGDVGTTPCNTPRNRGLKRRSTVVVAKGAKVREEVVNEGESQARLRPVELVRSLSCAA
ncbi:unnamed protein product [Aureobasidium mustum]|uniref:Uncharacterized protein n=1 Tax=Aureobasidium mustum TaxID=2773714 RepID=A0A9N8K712_9PEZI|nr:unnamed protein product [Aureobasidium mustum]